MRRAVFILNDEEFSQHMHQSKSDGVHLPLTYLSGRVMLVGDPFDDKGEFFRCTPLDPSLGTEYILPLANLVEIPEPCEFPIPVQPTTERVSSFTGEMEPKL